MGQGRNVQRARDAASVHPHLRRLRWHRDGEVGTELGGKQKYPRWRSGRDSVVTALVWREVQHRGRVHDPQWKCASIGGGIYCSYASPTIANNTITGQNSSYTQLLLPITTSILPRSRPVAGIYCSSSSADDHWQPNHAEHIGTIRRRGLLRLRLADDRQQHDHWQQLGQAGYSATARRQLSRTT